MTYNVARLVSYSALGAAFGGLGYALGSAAQIAQWSLILRVGLGLVMLAIGLRLLLARRGVSAFERAGGVLWRRLAPLVLRLDPRHRSLDRIALGLIWGFLPCGMVYSMLAVAALSGSATSGAATMFAFGMGTLPAMAGLSLSGLGLGFLRAPRARRGLGAALMLSGLWMAALPLYHALPGNSDSGHDHHHPHQAHHAVH